MLLSSTAFTACCPQVSDVDMEQDVVRLKMSEMLVGRMNLKYHDKKTGDIRDEGATKPEVIMRQLCTKPGQASLLVAFCLFLNPKCFHALSPMFLLH